MKFTIVAICCSIAFLYACTKDVGRLPFDDAALFTQVNASTGKSTWKNAANDSIFTSTATHGSKPYKLRVNAKALTVMTDGGKLPVNGTFPDSSLIVKQLYNASNQIELYAVMYKKDGAWLWAEYGVTGNVIHAFKSDANGCTGCHTSNRDKLWTFDSH